jgi:hypothetical protein
MGILEMDGMNEPFADGWEAKPQVTLPDPHQGVIS